MTIVKQLDRAARIPRGCILVLSMLLAYMSIGASDARAQPAPHAWRVFFDTNVLAYDWVQTTQSGEPRARHNVLSVGPNQLGGSQLWIPTTPLGVGVGYVVREGWMLDLRAGFGFDAFVARESDGQPARLAWSAMPGLSWIPPRFAGKLFLKFSPVLEFAQLRQGRERQRYFGGCFSAGAGSFLFMSDHGSVDVGVYFEGRFPDLDKKPDNVKVEYTDLRAVVRMGLSLWK